MAELGDKPYNVFMHRACVPTRDIKEKLDKLALDKPAK